jgi:DNA-binding transcriptional MerR regulator
MKTVKEVSALSGVSVRTLHHYDAIGLLPPTAVSEAGYRLYDEAALGRLQSILLYRALRFSLGEIKEILDSSEYDPREAIAAQIHLLELERARLDRLIALAQSIQEKGVVVMNFDAFDDKAINQYKEEAKARWGHTEAYQQSEERMQARKVDYKEEAQAMMQIFAEFGVLREEDVQAETVQQQVRRLQAHITARYYDCTVDILRGLGEMYTADERFKQNIDQAGGEGTADFVAQAIAVYCENHQ